MGTLIPVSAVPELLPRFQVVFKNCGNARSTYDRSHVINRGRDYKVGARRNICEHTRNMPDDDFTLGMSFLIGFVALLSFYISRYLRRDPMVRPLLSYSCYP